jgi:hypothetical protein
MSTEMGRYEVNGKTVTCQHCGHDGFVESKALLNTPGLTFLGLDWANEQAVTLLCSECGHIEWFVKVPKRSETALREAQPSGPHSGGSWRRGRPVNDPRVERRGGHDALRPGGGPVSPAASDFARLASCRAPSGICPANLRSTLGHRDRPDRRAWPRAPGSALAVHQSRRSGCRIRGNAVTSGNAVTR